ncbi:MAG: protein-L-isoaspartate(D-aspartate) O-methyltransferase [Acidobacteria bacterium]|nr:protein-L-isoaspartate(D-aspartate) O-methyltransferase [Acidobacteriota bacterium]
MEHADSTGAESRNQDSDRATERQRLVDQLRAEGIKDETVLAAMNRVPRHRFVPEADRDAAYENRPLRIGHEQTISQPFIVAYMTEALQLAGVKKVLEIGTGSGYQAAILAELVPDVYTIEIIPELAERASRTLRELGYRNVHGRTGDGYAGWPEQAPFERIIVTAAPPELPEALVTQLAVGGRMVVPVGDRFMQELVIVTKTTEGVVRQSTIPVLFVPMRKK